MLPSNRAAPGKLGCGFIVTTAGIIIRKDGVKMIATDLIVGQLRLLSPNNHLGAAVTPLPRSPLRRVYKDRSRPRWSYGCNPRR